MFGIVTVLQPNNTLANRHDDSEVGISRRSGGTSFLFLVSQVHDELDRRRGDPTHFWESF